MPPIQSFLPIATTNAQTLILGSMPGEASLAANQYYAHPQNAFWRIMAELLQFAPTLPYSEKIATLKAAKIALWDVLHSCTRKGSLDAMIVRDTQIANDFSSFFREHKNIQQVFFNGAKAEACFKQYVLKQIDAGPMTYVRLPSTSPANASISFERKLRAWRIIIKPTQN